jgi:peptide/nickel transport system substrate-binding protein
VIIDKDPSSRLATWLAGKLDFAPEYQQVVRRLDLATAKQRKPNLQTVEYAWFTSGAIGFKLDKPPFNDVRVRRALSRASSLGEVFETNAFSQGHWVPNPAVPTALAEWSIPIDQLGPEGRKLYDYSTADARRLLAEAGHPNGFATTLWVPESGSGMQSPVAMSTVIQSNLRAVGVNVSLQTMEWGAFLAKLRTKEQDLFALSWMAGAEDPDLVVYPLLHSSQWTPNGPNRALYRNARLDDLLQQARTVTDQARRAELYREAQRILADDPPWIFIDHEVQIAASSRRVQGFKLHPSFDLRVETISLR